MLIIDGSFGEGGGQILRTSLALSLATGKPFRIERIRAGREKPGLLRQHLTAVEAAATIGGAEVHGDEIGSKELEFAPRGVKAGNYTFSVGTAGSATLVLQTVLPVLLTASGATTLRLEGGTHNPFAPPFDFLDRAFLPLLNRMGPKVAAKLHRAGFYPAGGGAFEVTIEPSDRLSRIDLNERGAVTARRATAVVASLPHHIARRELDVIREKMSLGESDCHLREIRDSRGPGNIVIIEITCDHVTEVFTGFGERGVSAEKVAGDAVGQALQYLAADVTVGPYLADQLLLPMALAGGGSFTTSSLSRHATTNIDVIRKFLGVEIAVSPVSDAAVRVEITGS